ncbi:MAG: DUF4038 domain-containing protein [Limisphaerales bacterium]
MVSLVICFVLAANAQAAPAYPLKVSANKRYLVDQNNKPFLIVGDSPHEIVCAVNTADAATYLASRGSNGWNTVWVEIMCDPYNDGNATWSMLDGTVPFTNTLSGGYYDFTAPNSNYFAHVDLIVNMAATNGIQVFLDPLETGGCVNTAYENGSNSCWTFGQYLGNRYKNFTNIFWMDNNDYEWQGQDVDNVVAAIPRGILSKDTNHLHTSEFLYNVSMSMDYTNWWNIISANGIYSYYPVYAETLNGWNQNSLSGHYSNAIPVLMVETVYEGGSGVGDPGNANTIRRGGYPCLLSGGLGGYMYGNNTIWPFLTGWQAALSSPGAVSMQYFGQFFTNIAWYNLVPDQSHNLVTAGYGTWVTNGTLTASDYVTAAMTADGTLGVVYTPSSHTLTVAMTNFAGPVTAKWYDPTANTYTTVTGSPFTNTITTNLTTPGNNSQGDTDWVLLLQASASGTKPLSAFRITPNGSPTASSPYALTITAVDQYSNTVTNVTGDHSFTFAGLAAADDGTYPTITDKSGKPVNLGTATTITFTNGVSSAGGSLLAYKAQTATLTGSDATSGKTTSGTGGTGASLTIANVGPVGGAHYLVTTVSTPLVVSASTLASLDYDANHDILTITAVSPTSTNGPPNNVSLAAGTITYTPATGFVGADQFTYTISDSYGGTATSTANVTVQLGYATSAFNYISQPVDGIVSLRGYGIPGHSYDVQRSTDLVTWTTISGTDGVTAAADGIILYTDNPGSGTAYYRFAVHP